MGSNLGRVTTCKFYFLEFVLLQENCEKNSIALHTRKYPVIACYVTDTAPPFGEFIATTEFNYFVSGHS